MIGGGAISNAHLPAVAASEKAELICVADLNESTAKEKAEKFGARSITTDYHELLARDDIEAVIIGLPAGLHAEAALAAFGAGKHVLVEKPMARTLQECDAMIGAAERAGKVLQVAMVRRFDADWGKVRELVQAGTVGRPCLWRRMAQGSAPQPPYGAWYSDANLSDGPLSESGAHDFDFVRYTFGDVRAVTATNWQMGRVGDVLDTGIVTLDFESGDRMLCLWSWGLPPKCAGGTISGMDVLGPDGALQQSRRREDGRYECVVNGPDGAREVFGFDNPHDGNHWFFGQFDNFVESIHDRQTPRATGLDGRKAQEIALAAFESSRTGRRVELPL
jgi:predicted dehydrogenase